MAYKQIKSKKRVAEHGEVFTNKREVSAMLDLVQDEVSRITSTVLESACGEGAFILEIFERKMETIRCFGWTGWTLEYMILQAVSSIYGVDIQYDNVQACRNNLMSIASSQTECASGGFKTALQTIIERNIVCGDTLTGTACNGTPLAFSEWFFDSDGEITRRQYTYRELLDNGGECNTKHRLYHYSYMKKLETEIIPDGILA